MNDSAYQVQLHGLDYLVMGAYMAVFLGMGAFLRKRAGKDLESISWPGAICRGG